MQNALANFRASLGRIRDLANDALANAQQALADPALRHRQETALSAVVVTMSGYFESFLREVAEQYVDAICQQHHPFANLKDNIRYTHFQGGGQVLSKIAGKTSSARYSWTSATPIDVAKRLASVDAGPPYTLIWEAFADTGGNPGPDVVSDFLRRFGVERPMDTLTSNSPTSGISLRLKSFIEVRNECAHTGKATNPPTPSEVLGYCDLLEGIAAGIVTTLMAHQVC